MNDFSEIKLKYEIIRIRREEVRLKITIFEYPQWFKDIDFIIFNELASAHVTRLGKRRTFLIDNNVFFFHGSIDFDKTNIDNYKYVDFYSINDLQKWIEDVTHLFYALSKNFEDKLETSSNVLKRYIV